MNYYFMAFQKYAQFTGRSSRPEYWYFVLFNLIAYLVLSFIDSLLGTSAFSNIYSLIALIPGLAAAARRLHDVGKSGWMLLVGLIPIIGTIWLLVLMVTPGQSGSNKYGAAPIAPTPSK